MHGPDTIVALSTATGGAIAVIRVSGGDAIKYVSSLFTPANKVSLEAMDGYTISYGRIIDPSGGETVDQVLVSLFRAPRSYTGEDMVEISAHGSSYIARRIIGLLIDAGARPAEAGEFTVRAFLAGKMDLSQAEAVADMIASGDRATHAMAMNQMRGGYSSEFAALREQLLHLASLLELELDFSEEEVEFADRAQLASLMDKISDRINSLADSFTLGNALKEGIPVAITGKPNAGKSTLLNTLLKDDRAMVSDIAGTTRDVIEECIALDGIKFRFLDTAGLRETADPLERMGIERTYSSIEKARIVLWMVDAADILQENTDPAPPFPIKEDQHWAMIVNKIDRLTKEQSEKLFHILQEASMPVIPISAKGGINIGGVENFLTAYTDLNPLYHQATIVSNARHHEALTRSLEALTRARQSLASNLPGDLLSEDIRQTLHHLGTITGQITTDEILGSIFSKFCIGK